MEEVQIIMTSDGSNSLYVPSLDEHYHSSHGSIQEANHVFVNNGLSYLKKQEVNVLEVGFGTGLNALLSAKYASDNHVKISYTGIETNVLPNELVNKLNYTHLIQGECIVDLFKDIHHSKWGINTVMNDFFSLSKINQKIQDFQSANSSFDIVFYDAFGPRAQREMWEIDIFIKLFDCIVKGGVLVTYCAMGQLKRDLKEVGFVVETLPGPPGKREMVRAIKPL